MLRHLVFLLLCGCGSCGGGYVVLRLHELQGLHVARLHGVGATVEHDLPAVADPKRGSFSALEHRRGGCQNGLVAQHSGVPGRLHEGLGLRVVVGVELLGDREVADLPDVGRRQLAPQGGNRRQCEAQKLQQLQALPIQSLCILLALEPQGGMHTSRQLDHTLIGTRRVDDESPMRGEWRHIQQFVACQCAPVRCQHVLCEGSEQVRL
mmetsp:Transcript_27408/g.77148  ORF Transcript_27408/g.77148 Transcript_27408/m.77148 type:complete len:208 (-) Transcript_27408:508-1131(-)